MGVFFEGSSFGVPSVSFRSDIGVASGKTRRKEKRNEERKIDESRRRFTRKIKFLFFYLHISFFFCTFAAVFSIFMYMRERSKSNDGSQPAHIQKFF